MSSPLSRVRGFGSARNGTSHFLHQRMTALANLLFIAFLGGLIVSLADASYREIVTAFQSPWISVPTVLSCLCVLYHMALGMQVVIEDYVHRDLLKFLLLTANITFCTFLAVAVVLAVIKFNIGA